jgi:hypothetical protein
MGINKHHTTNRILSQMKILYWRSCLVHFSSSTTENTELHGKDNVTLRERIGVGIAKHRPCCYSRNDKIRFALCYLMINPVGIMEIHLFGKETSKSGQGCPLSFIAIMSAHM